MQADATLPAAQRRNYKNAFDALYRIVADEGVLALWKGAGPTVVRAMALNMGMLASYDQSVEFFKDSLGLGEASILVGKITPRLNDQPDFHLPFSLLFWKIKLSGCEMLVILDIKEREPEGKTWITTKLKENLAYLPACLIWTTHVIYPCNVGLMLTCLSCRSQCCFRVLCFSIQFTIWLC